MKEIREQETRKKKPGWEFSAIRKDGLEYKISVNSSGIVTTAGYSNDSGSISVKPTDKNFEAIFDVVIEGIFKNNKEEFNRMCKHLNPAIRMAMDKKIRKMKQ